MSAIPNVNASNFNAEVLQSTTPVLVDFYASWCMPCRMLAPVLEKLAGEFAGRVKIVKVDTEQAPTLANRYQVQSIPTLLFVAEGQVVGQSAGAPGERALRQALSQLAELGDRARRAV